MSEYIGVDWAGGCWVVVEYGDNPTATSEPSFLNVWRQHNDAESILVDVPIGLTDDNRRKCDRDAQQFLGQRSSTVFSIPSEEAIETLEDDPNAKSEVFEGLGSQTRWLIPQIREVRAFLNEYDDAVSTIHESHPEVCFAKLSDENALPSKTGKDGREPRLNALEAEVDGFGRAVRCWVEDREDNAEWHHRIRSGRLDDVIDAAVLALTAKLADQRDYPTLPDGRDVSDPPVIVHPGD